MYREYIQLGLDEQITISVIYEDKKEVTAEGNFQEATEIINNELANATSKPTAIILFIE